MTLLGLSLLLLCPPLPAQFSGRVIGTVLDTSGAPVPSAAVNLTLPGGKATVLATTTDKDGTYRLIGIRPASYDVSIAAQGFLTSTLRDVHVDGARETDVQPVTLQLASVAQSVDVTADADSVQVGNAEISTVITTEQIEKLPVLDRDPLALIQTQAGVSYNGNGPSVINGMRTSYANMTLDGINIQDNFIRDNALDYSPNRPLLGQVRQMTLVTSNANSAASGGSAQLAMETPSGTNKYHGGGIWYNRNSFFSGNDWFNNQSGVSRPRLNQNELGGSLGGPIRKDKLFFYLNYEAVRTNQQSPVTATVLTADARNGIYTYKDTGGVVRKVDLLGLRKIQVDPYMAKLLAQVPGPNTINSFEVGDSTAALLRNTAGYRFNQRSNEVRDNVTARFDYNLSSRQSFSGSYIWNRDNVDRPDLEADFSTIPKVTNPNHSHFLSTAWRWTPNGSLTNELRGGFNLAPGDFLTSQNFGSYLVTGMLFTDPVAEMLPQGRATNTYVVSDNAAWQHGRHYIQFGFHTQQIRSRAYDDSGVVPNYGVAMGTGQPALARADLTGIRSADVANANALLASLGGYVDSYSQSFNVTSRKSGFVNGASQTRNYALAEYDLYIQDNWKILPRLTATIGVRWDIPGVTDERDSLALLPQLQNGDPVKTLLSNATLNFAGASAGNPWYKRDWKDFAPNIGLSWDVFGNGKTALRAGYSIFYVNDQALLAPINMAGNAGLTGVSSNSGLAGRVTASLPAIPVPTYQVPLTIADNYSNNPFNTIGLIAPGLKTPYVQQWSVGIQHEFRRTVFEARYVGNHAVDGYRAFDYNQIDVKSNGFLGDFLKAQSNGYLALAKNGKFNPAYNPAITGSQALPVFAKLRGGGQLNNATVQGYLQTGEVGELASTYQIDGLNGSLNFFPNPNALGADLLTNYSNSTYHSLQLEVRHRYFEGLDFTANYTWSKVLSDAAGDSQSRVEQFLDVNNPKIERAPANFDQRHMIKANAVYELPIGGKHRLSYKRLDRIIGGWSMGGIMSWQSGAPFSILSGRGTLNRASNFRSYYNTADTALSGAQLNSIVSFQMTGNGPVIIAPSAINSDGTGVNADGSPNFKGQVFANPTAGTVGTLQRRMFYGPWSFDIDASLQKTVHITERHSVEIRFEGVNVLNHPSFFSGDQNINSTTFGVMASTFNPARVMQFGLKYQF